MKTARVFFHRCLQDSQELGGDEHMVSRVYFTLEIDDQIFTDLHADLKQTVGSDFKSGYIEVGPPQVYEGPFNHEAFSDAARRYYISSFGPQGRAIRINKGRMRNNISVQEMMVEFEVSA